MQSMIDSFCGDVRHLLNSTDNVSEIFKEGRKLICEFVRKPVFLKELLTKLVADDEFLMARWPAMDANEITLCRDKAGLFSLRLYVWDPAVSYPIHSHGSWGVVACVAGQIQERKYARLDDGSAPGYARIKEIGGAVLKPGETTTVLPLNEGIHRMESFVRESSSVSLHLYGRAVRGGFIEFFNMHKDSVYKVVPPKLYNRLYAIKALAAVREGWSEEILEIAAGDKKPFLRVEALRALLLLNREKAINFLEREAKNDTDIKNECVSLLRSIK